MSESASSAASGVRRGRLLRHGAAFAVLLALVGYVVAQYVAGGRAAPRCTVRAPEGDGPSYELSAEQASNAATISAVGTTRGMPERAVTIALATALQESALRNINHGDRDSLGLFQQRPSQGWGTPRQILDPVYASAKFYDHLDKVPGYSRLPLTVAAQRVQRSGFPQAYAKHEPDAALLAAALTGRSAASLTCESREVPVAEEKTADAARFRSELIRAFGRKVLPAPEGGAGRAGAPSSPEVSVPVPATAGTERVGTADRGWELAHWAVARAGDLGIDRVSYGGRVWSADASDEGWRREKPKAGGSGASGASGSSSAAEVRIRLAAP
ncbi:hypothetical protein [Streptomyces sp. MUM 178J]|uniref:hypothetical protein n=1 Tax=Streptomyces sp. MUM 178J TaxID=2791991 RepID=UPI001F04BE6F|nr:hypothetical protein [Streptomyces sp. MUM 178J]WRQ81471.1 hypothetical protein I3F59_020140 [Streptomyces sp. MUM 178J]